MTNKQLCAIFAGIDLNRVVSCEIHAWRYLNDTKFGIGIFDRTTNQYIDSMPCALDNVPLESLTLIRASSKVSDMNIYYINTFTLLQHVSSSVNADEILKFIKKYIELGIDENLQ